MYWLFRNLRFLFLASTMEFVTANDQCRTEVNIQGMALKRSVFKRWSVATPHLCDVKCGQEIACQSYNYNRKYQICELNNRTKEARPENFLSAPSWFYIRRLNGRGKKSEVYVNRCLAPQYILQFFPFLSRVFLCIGNFAHHCVVLLTLHLVIEIKKTCLQWDFFPGNLGPKSVTLGGPVVLLACGSRGRDNLLAWGKLFASPYELKSRI